jgi:two-component system OmpR family sensor kinase
MGVASVTTLVLAAAVLDQKRVEEKVRTTEERLRHIEEDKVAARDEFLSVAAHELKTPMTTLQIAVQFLLRQLDRGTAVDPDQLRRALAAVNEQSAKMGRLVGKLLDTARVQTQRMELDLRAEDVANLVAGAVERAQATTTRHEFVLSGPSRAPALVDALRLEQVLSNLLDNAIKFSPSGGRIEVELSTPAPQTVRLAVQDRGVGIPPDRRPHVFERFYQGHSGTRGSGLGLGLYLSRSIVALHGGRIEAEFPEGGGTRIVLHLPTRIAAAPGLRVPQGVQ